MRDGSRTPDTLVCVHGAGGGGWEWAIWARVFGARAFHVLAPDLQPVAAGVAATRLADYRDQVTRWCEGAGSAPILVGASLGGLLALSVARTARAAALVLVNPLSFKGRRDRANARPALIGWARERSLAGTRRALPDADDAARLYAMRRWRDESGAVLDEAEAGVAVETPTCPILVLAGECDEDIPATASGELAVDLGADFECIAGAGHLGPLLGYSAAATAARTADWIAERVVRCDPYDSAAV